MEKKSLNKKLQLNKETIAILDKGQQSQILGGDLPTVTCNSDCRTKCNTICAICVESVDICHEPISVYEVCVVTDNCDTNYC